MSTAQIGLPETGPDDLVRGRFEAVVTPSNFAGVSRYDAPGNDGFAAGLDLENDDPADIEHVTQGAPAEEVWGNADQAGFTASERAAIASADKKNDARKAAYDKAIAEGLSPDDARSKVINQFPPVKLPY